MAWLLIFFRFSLAIDFLECRSCLRVRLSAGELGELGFIFVQLIKFKFLRPLYSNQ